jgi:hypothetical protein
MAAPDRTSAGRHGCMRFPMPSARCRDRQRKAKE